MADYVSQLTGAQMDTSLLDMAQHTSEAWAVGERNGIPVEDGDPTYHNNAKYWAENAHESYYTVTYNGTTGDRTFSEILTAYNNGNMIILRYLTDTYYLNYADNYYIEFTSVTFSGTGNGAVFLFDIIRVTSLNAWIHLTEKFAPNNVANIYSASSTYAVGDYVLYNGLLYECTTAITTAEAWNSAHWSRAVMANKLPKSEIVGNSICITL